MNASQAASAYHHVGVHSGGTDASPHQLITMLLDGALSRISSAKGAMARGEIGDYVVVFQSGAYGPTASPINFLSHPHPREVLV